MRKKAERFVFRCDFCRTVEVRLFLCRNTDYLAVTFLEYAEKVMNGLEIAYGTVLSVSGNLTSAEQLMYFVRLTANSGFWVQHRSALRMQTDSGML